MLVTLAAWTGVIIFYLAKGELPDAALLGVPAFLVLALTPPRLFGNGAGAGRGQPESPSGDLRPPNEGSTR